MAASSGSGPKTEATGISVRDGLLAGAKQPKSQVLPCAVIRA
jgi:hypothetical protein